MWSHDGYWTYDRKRIIKGPNLQKLIASHNAFQAGLTLQLEFQPDRPANSFGHINPLRLCVASIESVDSERVDLKLVDHPNGSDFSYTIVYHYNHKRGRGNVEVFRKDERGPLGYDPVHLPSADDMMKFNDKEFILMYGLHMAVYQFVDGYNFPIACQQPGCKFVIRHALDMRKLGGQCLCPSCFAKAVAADHQGNSYLQRVAKLMPRRALAVPFWPDGVFPREEPSEE